MLAEPQNISSDFSHNLALVFRTAVLQHVLNYVIPILILHGERTGLDKRNRGDCSWVNTEKDAFINYLDQLLGVLMYLLQYG